MLAKTGLRCVGRLRKSPGLFQNPNNEKFDIHFSRYLMHRGVTDRFDDYKIARPSFNREMKAVSRYGLTAIDTKPDDEILAKVSDWIELEFGPHVEGSRLVDFDEVDIQGSSTPGIPYKWFTRTKREAIVKYLPDIKAFWKYAHVFGTKLLWHNFCKVEILPAEKVDSDNIRTITGPDIAYHVSYYRFVQDFNDRLTSIPLSTVSALGFNKFAGGVDELARRLNVHPNKEENDISKFDALFPPWSVTRLIRKFRWNMFSTEVKTPGNFKRLCYYYSESIQSYLTLVSGYVLCTYHGLKSGFGSTSTDGTIHHAAALFYAYITLVGGDYSHFKKNVVAALYGDDEILSYSDEVREKFTFEKRSECYRHFGMRMKPEAHRASTDLTGATFLGGRLKQLPTGQWVSEPVDPRKMVASLLKPPKPQTREQTLARAIALTYESYWHVETRDLIWGFVQEMVKAGVKPDPGASSEDINFDMSLVGTVPTLRMIERLWLGHQ